MLTNETGNVCSCCRDRLTERRMRVLVVVPISRRRPAELDRYELCPVCDAPPPEKGFPTWMPPLHS